jgi:HEPN domain-containing protein
VVSNPAAEYRLKVARGFLAEASQNFAAQQWRACVEHCQLSLGHAAKAALALAGPVPRTHDPAATLLRALEQERFPEAARTVVEQLVEVAGQLGPDIHIAISYGDEDELKTPWDLFDASDARRTLELASRAVQLAERLLLPA